MGGHGTAGVPAALGCGRRPALVTASENRHGREDFLARIPAVADVLPPARGPVNGVLRSASTMPDLTLALVVLLGALAACRKPAALSPRPTPTTSPRVRIVVSEPAAPAREVEPGRPACPPDGDPLDRAERALDGRDGSLALACAEEALVLDPSSAAAEHDRALALASLGRVPEAKLAYVHALALDPDDPDILLGAADLYLQQAGGREEDEIALAYVRRGERRARRRRPELLEQLELLEGMAENDLGQSIDGLPALEEALARDPEDLDARYEHAVALFELCRFAEARTDLARVLAALPDDAWAHHEMGLTLERLGDTRGARAELARATELSPKDFPAPLDVSPAEFARMVHEALAALPTGEKRDLAGVPVGAEDLPDLDDLTADDPPLSPTILGLFRGGPVGAPDAGGPAGCPKTDRAIVLYRKNLLRTVRSRAELRDQVRLTLLHELGHLRGADDDELRLEGLE